MKIIKQGKLPEEKEYQAKCSNCKTEISFKRKEATYVPCQRDGDSLTIGCPLCKQTIWVAI